MALIDPGLGTMPKLMLETQPSARPRSLGTARHLLGHSAGGHATIEVRWGVPWYEAFGMIESGLDIAVELDAHDEMAGTGCVGTPMPRREARVVDAEDRPVPAGEAGELVLRGVGLMDGYYRNHLATADAFRNGWLHTGDVVRQDGRGRFHYLSRMKDMIRRGGENIAAAEVEEVIMRHPDVRLAALLAVEDDLRGEEVMAYVVPGDGVSRQEVSPGGAERFLRGAARPVQSAALLEVPRRPAAHAVGAHPQGGAA